MKQREPVLAVATPISQKASSYPEPFAARVAGREKRRLGELFGLTGLGVNLTRLPPGAHSALRHSHSREEEFLFLIKGQPTLITDEGEWILGPGSCVGFPAGGPSHHLVNRSGSDAVYLEIGSRVAGDEVRYPHDDLLLAVAPDGRRIAVHKDGTPW